LIQVNEAEEEEESEDEVMMADNAIEEQMQNV
jgi:hypothetical protein